jgi:hypothetical protein
MNNACSDFILEQIQTAKNAPEAATSGFAFSSGILARADSRGSPGAGRNAIEELDKCHAGGVLKDLAEINRAEVDMPGDITRRNRRGGPGMGELLRLSPPSLPAADPGLKVHPASVVVSWFSAKWRFGAERFAATGTLAFPLSRS